MKMKMNKKKRILTALLIVHQQEDPDIKDDSIIAACRRYESKNMKAETISTACSNIRKLFKKIEDDSLNTKYIDTLVIKIFEDYKDFSIDEIKAELKKI